MEESKIKPVEIRRVPLEQMNPAPYNPRIKLEPGDPEYDALKSSMQTFGCVELIVWNEVTNNIVGGHRRYDVLVADGEDMANVVVVHIENAIDEKTLNAALNNIHGRWDEEKLIPILTELTEAGTLELAGFDPLEVERMLADAALDIDTFFAPKVEKETESDEHKGEIQCPECGCWFQVKK